MTSFIINDNSNILIKKVDFDERKIINISVNENEESLYTMLYSIKNSNNRNGTYSEILQHIIEYDSVYFEYIVHKLNYQYLPLLSKISDSEYSLLEEIIEKKEEIYISVKKLKIQYMKGFELKTIYFKLIFKYNKNDACPTVNLKYLPNNKNINLN